MSLGPKAFSLRAQVLATLPLLLVVTLGLAGLGPFRGAELGASLAALVIALGFLGWTFRDALRARPDRAGMTTFIAVGDVEEDRTARRIVIAVAVLAALLYIAPLAIAPLRHALRGGLSGGWMLWPIGGGLVFNGIARRRTVSIGTDGLRIDSPFRTRFVPLRAIAKITVIGLPRPGVCLALRDGSEVRLCLLLADPKGERLDTLVARLGALLENWRSPTYDAATASLVTPREETDEEWIARVRALGVDAGYRAARVPREELWRIVEHPLADAAARAGAAVALSAELSDEERGRLRIAADACAEAATHDALAALANEEEDGTDVARALARPSRFTRAQE